MSVIYNNIVVKEIKQNDTRILQRRDADRVSFNEPDIVFYININTAVENRPNTSDLVISFDANLDWIIGNYNIGENVNKFKKVINTNTISKSTKTNDDDNGPGNGLNFEIFRNNNIYLPEDLSSITALTISQVDGVGGIQGIDLVINKEIPNLITYINDIPQAPNFLFLDALMSIFNLSIRITPTTFSNLNSLKNSNLISLKLIGYNPSNPPLLANLPDSLYYLQITQIPSLVIDLADYFTGTRIGLNLRAVQSVSTLTYSGGAIFPSNLSDTPQFEIDYIINQANIPNKLTGDELSQFIIDFANQVTSVSLQNPAAKRMRFTGSVPNTSYSDPSQSLFTTYIEALAHITETLGVTVQFT